MLGKLEEKIVTNSNSVIRFSLFIAVFFLFFFLEYIQLRLIVFMLSLYYLYRWQFLMLTKLKALDPFIPAFILKELNRRNDRDWPEIMKRANLCLTRFMFIAVMSWLVYLILRQIITEPLVEYINRKESITCILSGLFIGFFSLYEVRSADYEENMIAEKAQVFFWKKWIMFISFLFSFISFMFFLNAFRIMQLRVFPGFFLRLSFCALFIIAVETWFRSFRFHYRCVRKKSPAPVMEELLFFRAVFSTSGPIKGSLSSLKELTGLDFANTRSIRYVIDIAEPVILGSLVLFWLFSVLYFVPIDGQGLRTRFGRVVSRKSAEAGMHLKMPWPIEKAESYTAYRLGTLNIGFEPDPRQSHMIWTRSHTKTAFNLVLGDGLELISIDMQISYRVKNLYDFLYETSNPEDFLEALAYRALTDETVSSSFDQVMVRDRHEFSERLREKIQSGVDEFGLGMEVTAVNFLALHPPLEVAEAFEDVISAKINKTSEELTAIADRQFLLATANATAVEIENTVAAYSYEKQAESESGAISFLSRLAGYKAAPDIVDFRLRLEKTEKVLAGKKLYIMDSSLLKERDILNLDMRVNNF